MAISRFENYDPMVFQTQPIEYVNKLPGELLLKAGAVQQERYDKVNKELSDVNDLLNIKVDPKDLPTLKAKQAYYNDKLTTVAQNMAEGKTPTSKAAVDLLGIKKELVKDEFLRYAPANYENIVKTRQEAEKTVSSGEVSPHNYVFNQDYANWKGTTDPSTGTINVFNSAGAYDANSGNATNDRFLAPGAPRAGWVGVRYELPGTKAGNNVDRD